MKYKKALLVFKDYSGKYKQPFESGDYYYSTDEESLIRIPKTKVKLKLSSNDIVELNYKTNNYYNINIKDLFNDIRNQSFEFVKISNDSTIMIEKLMKVIEACILLKIDNIKVSSNTKIAFFEYKGIEMFIANYYTESNNIFNMIKHQRNYKINNILLYYYYIS